MKKILFLALIIAIVSCNRNLEPTCVITSPANEAVFLMDDTITISVNAEDIDGEIIDVILYIDDYSIATLNSSPYNYAFLPEDYMPGIYKITAVATDNDGAQVEDTISFQIGAIPSVETENASIVRLCSAIVGGNVTNPGSEEIIETGIYIDTLPDPELSGTKIVIGNSSGEFLDTIADLEFSTIYYVKAYAANIRGEGIGNEVTFTTLPGVKDIEGNIYAIVEIGEQWWMKENLKTTTYNDGAPITNITDQTEWEGLISEAYCWYNNDEDTYGSTYGAFYNGFAANSSKICPKGWHVPSDDDWMNLELFMGMSATDVLTTGYRGTDEGGKLKETGNQHWEAPNEGATDAYGFTALPGGNRVEDSRSFEGEGLTGWFWTSTYSTSNETYRRLVRETEARISRSLSPNQRGMSIRCIKD